MGLIQLKPSTAVTRIAGTNASAPITRPVPAPALPRLPTPGSLNDRARHAAQRVLASAGITINGNAPYDINVNDPAFFARVLRDPSLELGRSYMDGQWDCAAIDELSTKLQQARAITTLRDPDVLLRTPGLLAQAAGHTAYRWLRDAITNRQTRSRSTTVAKEHYDIGNILYQHQLGPTMAYTSGVFAPGYDLEDAQNAKHDLLCRKMGLEPGDRVLDIGCGFGGFARYAAQHYGAEVVGITISDEQLKAARALSQDVKGVSFLYSDYRDLPSRFAKESFDHVVSIEMIEAVGPKNLRDYFEAAQACLKPGGTFALQAICSKNDVVNCNAWFSEYIFQDGVAPSRKQVDTAAADWFGAPEDVHGITESYDRTLMEWHKNFTEAWPQLQGDYSDRFKRMWDFYLLSVAGGFRSKNLNVDQVVYRKGGAKGGAAPVRALPTRAFLDSIRATPEHTATTAARLAEVEAHTKAVNAAAAPKLTSTTPLAKDARICVVGAGPSGLTVAHELKAKGYSNVVVLEATDHIGGKSFTVDFAGRKHDMGATMGVQYKYSDLIALADNVGVKTIPFPKQVHYDLTTGKPRDERRGFWGQLAFVAGVAAYIWSNAKYVMATGHGLEVPPASLADSLSVVGAREGFGRFVLNTETWRTGFGYGFTDETPAVYPMRMLNTEAVIGAPQQLAMWEHGTTPIWEGVAKDLDVRSSTPVTSVDRSGEQVIVTAGGKRMEFDRLVVACDPATATSFLDASSEEKDLFANIQHTPYSTFACRVKGLWDGESMVGSIADNMTRERIGHPMAWIKRYTDDDLCIFHLFAPPAMSDDEVTAKIREDMKKLGASDVELVRAKRWKFFPHVSSDAMRLEKFFERGRNLQGAKHTFYANEVLSMSTMADTNEFAKTIAERVATSG